MDAEVDNEAGPCNGSPDVDRTDDPAASSLGEESVPGGQPEAHDEDENSQDMNGHGMEEVEDALSVEGNLTELDEEEIENQIEEVEEEEAVENGDEEVGNEEEVELEEAEAEREEEMNDEVGNEEDEVGNEEEEVENEEEEVENEEDEIEKEEEGVEKEDGAENEEEEVEKEEAEVDKEEDEVEKEEEFEDMDSDVAGEGQAGSETEEVEAAEREARSEEEPQEEDGGGVETDGLTGETADDAEEEMEEKDEKDETGEGDSPDAEVKNEPDFLPEMGDEYDEDFVSIPVECDLQEESQEAIEKPDSGSNYSAEEAEDSNDEDYRPRPRCTRSRKPRREFDDDLPEETSEELREAYRIFLEITVCAGTHFLNHPSLDKGAADYLDIIERPMWLEEIKQRFLIGEYSEVEQFVTDLRLILINCYHYYGHDSPHTRKALKIEQLYSQKVAALPEEEKKKFMLDPEATEKDEGEEKEDGEDEENSNHSGKSPKRKEFHSSLLNRFGEERKRREEERRNALDEERKQASSDNEKQKLEWERETLFENASLDEMKSMWEIPQISQILQLTRSSLCMEDLPQYEVERMFLMPQSSKLLAILMTSLLSPPISRSRLQSVPPMPYSIWSKKLAQRVAFWYKSYNHRNKDSLKAFQYLGIEAEFWAVMGDWNQLEDYEFFELSFHQRVWIIKSLIDYLMHHHKRMHDILAEHCPEDQICTYLGEDREGRQYLHFPIFNRGADAVRVYRQRPHIDNWAPDPVDPNEKPIKTTRVKQTRRGGKKFGRGSSAKRKGKSKRKQLYDFRNLHFISRNTYRMPYSLHAGRKARKRRGKLPEAVALNSDKPEPDVPFEENVDCSATNSPEVSQDGQEFRTRSLRSTRNKYQANYLDWSDSDEQPETKAPLTRSQRAFSTVSEGTQNSKSDEQTVGDMTIFASVPESFIADDATQDASLLSDDNASSLGKGGKSSVKGEESDADEDEDEDDLPDTSPTKIEEYEEEALWLTKSTDKKETRRPRYDPTWLLPKSEDFELVADSVQGIRDLIESFSDEDDVDLIHRVNNSETKSKRTPEQRLKKALLSLVEELEPLELKLEMSARLSRNKMYNEWFEWRLRGEDFKDSAEIYWMSLLDPVNCAPPALTPQLESPIKEKIEIKKEETESNSVSGEVENSNAPSEATTQSEEANAEGEGRHTRRSKRRVESNGLCGDSFQSAWPDEMSTEEESERESDHDDSWEMPSKRKRKKTKQPKKRPLPKEGQEEGEEQPKKSKKKAADKTAHVKKRLWGSEDAEKDKQKGSSTVNINDGLHSKLTLDKQGNLFITMSSGERIPLEKDDEERIKVPDSLPKFAVLNGKTLQQLFGENRVIPKTVRRKECSTTLFPALPMPPVYGNRTGGKDEKEAGTSASPSPKTPEGINDPNIDVMKLMANKVTIHKSKPGEQRVYPPSAKPKLATPAAPSKKDDDVEVIATKKKPKVDADIVYLSDGSDDSIELIQESTPTKPTTPTTPRRRDGIPRIQKVVGNAKIDLPAATVKNLSKSVTMSPVLPRHVTPTKTMTPTKDYQWKPVITNSRSLNANPTRMAAPGGGSAWKGQRQVISSISPEVQITTTRKPTTQRNLSVYRTPNQAFVPVTSLSTRSAQSNFVPVNQFVPMNNQYNNSNRFQPVNNQFVPVNSPHFVPLNSQSMVQVNPVNPQPPRVRMLAGNTTITPLPTPGRPQPVQAQGSPALTGQIVLVNTDKGFSYAVKLADGGTIFLTQEQVAKIREANSGKLTTMVTLHTN